MISQYMRSCSLSGVQQGSLAAAATAALFPLISQPWCTQWPAQQQHKGYSSQNGQCTQQAVTSSLPASPGDDGLSVTDLPPYIILLRHGESAGLENLQEELQIPNHRVPLSAQGVQQSFAAGQHVHELLHDAHDHHQQQQQQHNGYSVSSCSSSSRASSKVFMYTSPFLRCIQTAQHVVRALKDQQLVGFKEEVQLREQDWGNFQAPGQQTRNYEERLKYGRFFFRFPEGESAADVYDRMTMFQDHFVRDIACKRFADGTSVMMVTHGLALRLFLMRWLHWTVDEFLQVHNPPTAAPVVLVRECPELPEPGEPVPQAFALLLKPSRLATGSHTTRWQCYAV
ncbi:histidine phosphatase superfamily [Scenedesmus sp. NREL 46B-D3]|nr:histidine phosphatase superfamily [Scenedesmus sp. NREL 46B-D3]